jgi:Flp pilus assembly protein TadG
MSAQDKSAIGFPPSVLARLARVAADETGGNIAEFALAAVILFSLVFAIMGFSMVMFSHVMTSEAARAGARYAIVRGDTWTSNCRAPGFANCIAQRDDIQTFVKSAVPSISKNLTVDTTWLNSSGSNCGGANSCKSPGNQVQVTATYTYLVMFPFINPQKFRMTSTSQMVIAQ